ncbi:hypothetical protein PQX77_016741 [Marasmius sp. AFHP31]|nr:hypothetical protein PQX77_016741 [Marasmius sp. AFHP31]
MSSKNPPVRKRSRTSRKSSVVRTQPVSGSKDKTGESVNEARKVPRPVGLAASVHFGIKDSKENTQGVEHNNAPSPEVVSTKERKSASGNISDRNKNPLETTPGVQEENLPDEMRKTEKPDGNESRMATEPGGMKPMLEKSWEVVMKEVDSLDDGLVKGRKEDIDTLLVFAGLFSAVVTAFTIESYQWLEEQPEDTTVALLRQLSWQQINGTTPPDPLPFEVSTSVVCINVLWFLSLIIALVDALFALLCKQWLREHSCHTHTRTAAEALALRWLRNKSLEKWHVPTILASLPMLLELALFLFLAGLLELLRKQHPVPFGIATIFFVVTALFYIGTTIIPSVNIIHQALQVTQKLRKMHTGECANYLPVDFITSLPPLEYTCPLKSPQAWAAFQCFKFISCISTPIFHLLRFLWLKDYVPDHIYHHFPHQLILLQQILSGLASWSSVDLELLRRSNIKLAPPFYELSAFQWLVAELRDSPSMIPHLRNILSTIPKHLVMPAVLDQWFFLPDREWTDGDIEEALRLGPNNSGIQRHISSVKQECLDYFRATDKFHRLLHWVHVSINDHHISNHFQHSPRPQILLVPFSSIDQGLKHHQLFSCLWELYMQMVEDPAVQRGYLAGLMEDLAPHIIACSPNYAPEVPTATSTSPFVESDAGHEFLHKIHDGILKTRANDRTGSWDIDEHWVKAMDIVHRVHRLPEGHFKLLPPSFAPRLSKLKESLSRLSPTSPATNFCYLDSFRIDWGNENQSQKEALVQILSEHINNYPQSTTHLNTHPDISKVSPLLLSSAGLELITVVNNQLAEDWRLYSWLDEESRIAWHEAMEQVKIARPDLPPDHFKDISHESLSILPTNVHPSIQEDVPQAGTLQEGSISSWEVNGREENHGNEMTLRSSNSVSSLDAIEEERVQPAVNDVVVDSKEEDMHIQLLEVGGSEQRIMGSGSEERKIGGPGADDKV